jgi:tetratricopeptide (TPR) repeat protein
MRKRSTGIDLAGRLAILVLGGILILSAAPSRASEEPQGANEAERFIAEGDSLYALFDYAAALSRYQAAVAFDSTLSEPLWKSARSLVDAGNKAEKKKKKELYTNAVRFARWAVRVNPDDSYAHLYDAIAVGKLALLEGGKTKIRLSEEVRRETLKAIKLDPGNDSAYHVLARWHREVANLSGILKAFAKILYGGVPAGASNDSSVYYFKKAVSINPGHINHHLELGRTYMMMKQWESAEKELEQAISLPVAEVNDPDYKREAEKLLDEVKKKIK